jgi:hypothetical protein
MALLGRPVPCRVASCVRRCERGAALYLEHGCLSAADVAYLRASINSLCGMMVEGGEGCLALGLAAAWGIPEHLIKAPIAGDLSKL